MRVTQIAELAGTTPRAVRHYHRLGLLEVPPTVRGKREYGVEHLARLMRIRWLADGGLSLRQVAQILRTEAVGDGVAAGDSGSGATAGPDQATGTETTAIGSVSANREAVLRDLRATKGTIEAQRRSLAEQSKRVDELICRVEAGEALAPVPLALTRFYDALESRVDALGGDLRFLRAERQMMYVLGSLGMAPASAAAFVEDFDDADLETCAKQMVEFSRLTDIQDASGNRVAIELAEQNYALVCKHRALAVRVLDDLPGGVMGRTLWRLTHVLSIAGYPHPAQRTYSNRFLELLLADPDFAPIIRRSAGKELVL